MAEIPVHHSDVDRDSGWPLWAAVLGLLAIAGTLVLLFLMGADVPQGPAA